MTATHCIPYNEDCSICNPPLTGNPDARSSSTPPSTPLTPWEARQILGSGGESGRPGYLCHHPDCTPPSDCECSLFAIQNRLREIAESAPATPSSPAERADDASIEFREALAEFRLASARFATASPFDLDNAMDAVDSAGRAVQAIYNKQREEIAELTKYAATDPVEVRATLAHNASLSSQLERLREKNERLDWCEQSAVITDLQAQLERLKAEQRFTEDDWWQVDQAVLDAEVLPRPEIQIERLRKIAAALRLRSLK